MQCKKQKYFLQLCLCFHSCAFVFTVVPCCCMIPTFVFADVHFFCCCAIFLLFCNLHCYLFVLSFSTKKMLQSINCYPHRSTNTPLPDLTTRRRRRTRENKGHVNPTSLHSAPTPHPLSPHSTLHEKLALRVRSMPLLLPLAAAVVTPVGHLLLPTPSWPVSIVTVTAVNQRTKD
jgi:hypothetical protein